MTLFAYLIIRLFRLVFFSRNNVFLSQQIIRNSVSACFFSEANGANRGTTLVRCAQGQTNILLYLYIYLLLKKQVQLSSKKVWCACLRSPNYARCCLLGLGDAYATESRIGICARSKNQTETDTPKTPTRTRSI